jgi:hypothetical protein
VTREEKIRTHDVPLQLDRASRAGIWNQQTRPANGVGGARARPNQLIALRNVRACTDFDMLDLSAPIRREFGWLPCARIPQPYILKRREY